MIAGRIRCSILQFKSSTSVIGLFVPFFLIGNLRLFSVDISRREEVRV